MNIELVDPCTFTQLVNSFSRLSMHKTIGSGNAVLEFATYLDTVSQAIDQSGLIGMTYCDAHAFTLMEVFYGSDGETVISKTFDMDYITVAEGESTDV